MEKAVNINSNPPRCERCGRMLCGKDKKPNPRHVLCNRCRQEYDIED